MGNMDQSKKMVSDKHIQNKIALLKEIGTYWQSLAERFRKWSIPFWGPQTTRSTPIHVVVPDEAVTDWTSSSQDIFS